MKNNLWIFLCFGFFLLAQGLPHPAEDGDSGDDEDAGPPSILHSKNQTFIFDVGETVRLPCKVENPDNAVIIWWLDNAILWADRVAQGAVAHTNFKLDDDHTLVINDLKPDDSGVYNCSVLSNDALQFVIYKVHVAGKPEILRIVPEEDRKLEKGTPLTLMCEAAGYPTPEITWTKKSKQHPDKEKEKLVGSTISIDMVTRKDIGIYECKASNSKGEDTKRIEIQVLYEPELEVGSEVIYAGEGYESELVCIVHGEPKPKVSWLKDDQPLNTGHHHITTTNKGNKHYLRISGTQVSDYGVYRCLGHNSKGTNSKTITLSGKPTKPKFHAAEESPDSKSPVLSWSVESYSTITSYELLYRIQDKGEWKSVEVPVDLPSEGKPGDIPRYIAKHTLNSLEPVVYQAQLRAKNNFGWSELSEPHSFFGHLGHSSDVVTNSDEVSQTGLLESAQNDPPNTASQLRISFAFMISLIVAQYYC